jgi:DNA-binding protein H-NS
MPRRAAMKLGDMTVAQLLQLREKVQTALSSKIKAEREELERKINLLSNLEMPAPGTRPIATRRDRGGRRASARRTGNGKSHPLKGRTVAPKYRDPANPNQTWAGRGQAPRWLVAYENQGRKRDEFLIGATTPAGRSKGRRRR